MDDNLRYVGVYERLVSGEDDVVGQIAYSIYKRRKRDFIIRKQEELKTEHVPEEVIADFVRGQTDSMLELYKEGAFVLSGEFLKASYGKELDTEVAKIAKTIKPQSWWYGVAQSFVASFLFLLTGYAILKLSGSWDILLNNLLR